MSAVEDLLSERGIYYQISGKDVKIKCLNPDHDDRNPSMRIDRILGVFHCFSCGYKGSLFQHYGVEVSQTGLRREKLRRKINDIRSSGVGLVLPEGSTPFKRDWRGISACTYEKFEAFYNIGTNFNGRVNFPIRDASGRIIAFQGRDETGTLPNKYMFTPSGVKLPLFPMAEPIQGKVILVEGIFDMLNLHDKGLTNAICCFGVNNFNEQKLELLKISGVTGLDLIFDGDEAGKGAADRIKKLAGDFPVRQVGLRSGDPGDLNLQQVQNIRRRLYG
jgi:DNA primase